MKLKLKFSIETRKLEVRTIASRNI